MTEYTIEQVTAAYVRLRQIRAEKESSFKQSMEPIEQKMTDIENWLLNQMNVQGVDSFKTKSGTPYKKTQTSVSLAEPEVFRDFVLKPAAEGIGTHLQAMGYVISPTMLEEFKTVIGQLIRWDVVDFRVGKKGVQEFIEEHDAPPPGVAITQFATVNIRKG